MMYPTEKVCRISIQKLLEYNDPFTLLGITEQDVFSCKKDKEYLSEQKRTKRYHGGRVLYFVNQIKSRKKLDSILIEFWQETDASDPIILVYNGLHRLAACILTGRKLINSIEMEK